MYDYYYSPDLNVDRLFEITIQIINASKDIYEHILQKFCMIRTGRNEVKSLFTKNDSTDTLVPFNFSLIYRKVKHIQLFEDIIKFYTNIYFIFTTTYGDRWLERLHNDDGSFKYNSTYTSNYIYT